MREELYDELIRDLEHVSRDVRDTEALFLQDLRDDCVDWRWVGDRLKMWSYKDKERFFREFAGPCMRATRVTGSECLKFAHEHGAPWDKSTCARAARNGHLECLTYAHEHGCCSARYAKALNEVAIPDADERFGVEVALAFHRAPDTPTPDDMSRLRRQHQSTTSRTMKNPRVHGVSCVYYTYIMPIYLGLIVNTRV